MVEAIELYRKAKARLDAAKLLFDLAAKAAADNKPPIRVKQLYVLGAMEVEDHRDARGNNTAATLDGLLEDDQLDDDKARVIEHSWRGAEGYHFLLLAQRQLYTGWYSEALRTAVRLSDYDDLVDPETVYSILALAAVATRNYGLCSKAFVKLESLAADNARLSEQTEALALEIFSKHPPKDTAAATISCPKCSEGNPDWATSCSSCSFSFLASVCTGRPMVDLEYWICSGCKHRAGASEISTLVHCPLCHTPVDGTPSRRKASN
jgi:WD repeat-containing protein 35